MDQLATLYQLAQLDPRKINELLADLRQRQGDVKVIYTFDPYELVDFCFPINPNLAERTETVDFDRIANDQVGLHELFELSDHKALLLDCYQPEVDGLSNHFGLIVSRVYREVETVDALVRGSRLQSGDLELRHEAELVARIEASLNAVLAVSLGLVSLGVRRFSTIVSKRLMSQIQGRVADRPTLNRIAASYKRSRLFWDLLEALERSKRDADTAGNPSPTLRESERRVRKARANRADAEAIDRILFLNRELALAFENGSLQDRYLILYVSSASRTRHLFNLAEVREALPRIDGRPYNIWRDRTQLFALAAFRGSGADRRAKLADWVRRLVELRTYVDEIGDFDKKHDRAGVPYCDDCALRGGAGTSCDAYNVCQNLRRIGLLLHRKQGQLHNLGLAERLEAYKKFLGEADTSRRRTHQEYILFVEGVLNNQKARDGVLARMRDVQQLIVARSEFWRDAPGRFPFADFNGLADGRDLVTGATQSLPLRVEPKKQEYRNIARALETAIIGRSLAPEKTLSVYDRFSAMEADLGELDPDHELIRCLLYLASPVRDGDERGLRLALAMRERFPSSRKEFEYVALWAMRRLQRYHEADSLSRDLISSNSDDPRIYHGRLLNCFSWGSQQSSKDLSPLLFREALTAGLTAIRLYEQRDPPDLEVLAALYNDVAYLKCSSRKPSRRALREAREYLARLKTIKPKSAWVDGFPEYFHTEAALELEEFRAARSDSAKQSALRAKLESAVEDIRIAIRLRPKRIYRALERRILDALNSSL
jgi:hypothetical protein